ncbi:hypothetical protein DSO57_1036227 [Entomophthora muscae]|uniref:Uncharacterized protein n=1 Tax=Entomophthora muscae TaxID=34485 RepID=A0ACC2SC23_9FUNG|nr:hypothetical protein DSO57_1036227 [Entomophthora muscae]
MIRNSYGLQLLAYTDFAELFMIHTNSILTAIGGVFSQLVRIDNFSPLELQAQEQESELEPGFPRGAGPEDCKTNHPHFPGIKHLQADVEEDDPPRKVD